MSLCRQVLTMPGTEHILCSSHSGLLELCDDLISILTNGENDPEVDTWLRITVKAETGIPGSLPLKGSAVYLFMSSLRHYNLVD